MQAKFKKNLGSKRAILRKMVRGKVIPPVKDNGASPFLLDNGLGRVPASGIVKNPGDGGGSNLGTSGVF